MVFIAADIVCADVKLILGLAKLYNALGESFPDHAKIPPNDRSFSWNKH